MKGEKRLCGYESLEHGIKMKVVGDDVVIITCCVLKVKLVDGYEMKRRMVMVVVIVTRATIYSLF